MPDAFGRDAGIERGVGSAPRLNASRSDDQWPSFRSGSVRRIGRFVRSATSISPRATANGGSSRASPISPSAIRTRCRSPGIVAAIRERAVPHDKNWFAYKTSEAGAAGVSRRARRPRTRPRFRAGGHRAHHRRLCRDLGGVPARARCRRRSGVLRAGVVLLRADAACRRRRAGEGRAEGPRFDLDLAAIEAAIGPKTRLVIVNTPHNPTGRIYSREALAELGDLLERASARIGRRIFLLSDEPYRRLRFDGRGFVSPAAVYPWTLISYSYGKVLLSPGQRLGYLAVSPLMPAAERKALREAMVGGADGARLVLPERGHAVRAPGPRGPLHRPGGAGAAARPAAPGARRVRATSRSRRREPSTSGAAGRRATRTRHWNALADHDVFVMPGSADGRARVFPDQPDRIRRDGRAGGSGLSRGGRGGVAGDNALVLCRSPAGPMVAA